MKVIKYADPAHQTEASTLHDWANAFRALVPDAIEMPTNYHDGGETIRFKFANSAIAEWKWRESSPREAALESAFSAAEVTVDDSKLFWVSQGVLRRYHTFDRRLDHDELDIVADELVGNKGWYRVPIESLASSKAAHQDFWISELPEAVRDLLEPALAG